MSFEPKPILEFNDAYHCHVLNGSGDEVFELPTVDEHHMLQEIQLLIEEGEDIEDIHHDMWVKYGY